MYIWIVSQSTPQFAFQAIAFHAHCGYKPNPFINPKINFLIYESTWFKYIQKSRPVVTGRDIISFTTSYTCTPAMHLIRASYNAGNAANSTWLLYMDKSNPFDLQLRSDIHLYLTRICITPSQTLLDFPIQTTVSVTVFMGFI